MPTHRSRAGRNSKSLCPTESKSDPHYRKRARSDLRGGRPAMVVSTATVIVPAVGHFSEGSGDSDNLSDDLGILVVP